MVRSSYQRCSVRKGVLTNFPQHLCHVSFLIELQASACNFIKKETLTQVFPREFCEISKNTFFTGVLSKPSTTDHRSNDPPTSFHLPTDSPTTCSPTHRPVAINLNRRPVSKYVLKSFKIFIIN